MVAALVRLEQKGSIGGQGSAARRRRGEVYAITNTGARALERQAQRSRRLASLVDKLLMSEG